MRIVAGKWAGVSLVSPGTRVRPTREEIRDGWITTLEPELAGARVLDLFAGTGALGLEALSRGAAYVDFVENGKGALHALKANIAKLRLSRKTRLFKKDAFLFLEGVPEWKKAESVKGPEPGERRYDIVLADPPYTSRAAERLADLWLERPFSRILSVEHATDQKLPRPGKRRVFQDSTVTTYRLPKQKGS